MKRDELLSFRITKENKRKLENWKRENLLSMADILNTLITLLDKDTFIEHFIDNYQTDLLEEKISEKIKIKESIKHYITKK